MNHTPPRAHWSRPATAVFAGMQERRRNGSSLLLVLWAIMLMSFSVIGLVSNLARGLDESIGAEKEFRARLLLQSARVLAAHPQIEWGDPLLIQRVSSSSSYAVDLHTEGERLAINQLASNPVQLEFAHRLFVKWGMDDEKAETLCECIADWIDGDDAQRRRGAERNYYVKNGRPDFPYNRPLSNIDDVLLIRGADELDRVHPNWRDAFTLFGDGTIDMHRAAPELLEVLFDVTPSEVRRFADARLGPDLLRDTMDDVEYNSLAQIRGLLDVPQANYAAVSGILALHHPITRINCTAHVGDLERQLTIILGPGIYLMREH